jgi:hypothetical protein
VQESHARVVHLPTLESSTKVKEKQREYYKQYELKNNEKRRIYSQRYSQKNKEKRREYHRLYEANNKTKRREYNKKYELANKERIRGYHQCTRAPKSKHSGHTRESIIPSYITKKRGGSTSSKTKTESKNKQGKNLVCLPSCFLLSRGRRKIFIAEPTSAAFLSILENCGGSPKIFRICGQQTAYPNNRGLVSCGNFSNSEVRR